jgi:hypothetical protein
MLPYALNMPTGVSKEAVRVLIAPPVGQQLICPPYGVRFRERAVTRTAVPKAAVHKHGNLCGHEHDVGPSADAGEDRAVDAKA